MKNFYKILLIEDNSKERKYILSFLKQLFTDIFSVHDTEEALEIVKHNTIDILITSLGNENIDTLKIINYLNKNVNSTRTIVLFQKDNIDLLLESLTYDADSYIQKPFTLDSLKSSINKVIGTLENKIKLQNTQEYINQYQKIIEQSSIISKTDCEGIITYVNDKFCNISGYQQNELIGQSHGIIQDSENPKSFYENIWYTIKNQKKSWEGVIKNKAKNGKPYYIKSVISPLFDTEGRLIEYLSVSNPLHSSIDDKKHMFNKIEENFLSILVLLQIDQFDMLEKFYNIETIDQVEKSFTYNLPSYLPAEYRSCNVYFLSNGRFALLMEYDSFERTGLNINQYLSDFILNVKQSTLKFDEIEFDLNITLSYSIGKYLLFEDAKAGLENALKKKTSLNFANDYSMHVTKEAEKNLEVIKMVKIALDNFNIVSYFQPIINNKTQEIEKYESLVRLIDENGNIVSPYEFLDISKQGNYYNKITDRVLENSFKILDKVKTKISINISVIDIENEQTNETIFRLLDEYKDENNRIIFELLEDENVKDFKLLKEFIHKVKKRGIQIAIDDFGTGYSNFERLLEFEPDILKIDGSIIKNINKDKLNRDIVETIVSFAKCQNIETIAEYVESEEIFNVLNEIGVTYSQGYYFGQPKCLNNKEVESI